MAAWFSVYCLACRGRRFGGHHLDSEEFNGWQQLRDSYVNGYPDRNSMGFLQPKRIQVKLLKPDFALALTWWSAYFPSSKRTVVGTSTMNLQKFDDGWKIVAS